MSDNLTQKKCVPCEGGMPPLDSETIRKYQPQVHPDWQVIYEKSLQRRFDFKNFLAAVNFINQIAAVAEQEGHHPDLHLTNYRKLTIELSTHSIGGLSENDFIMAAKIDDLFQSLPV